jgi:hypothetical protein
MMPLTGRGCAPEVFVGKPTDTFMLGFPVGVDAVPPFSLEDMTALGAFAGLAGFESPG